LVVGIARRAVLAAARHQQRERDRQPHGRLPLSIPETDDPTNSAASSSSSDANTNNGNFSAGISRLAASIADRMIGFTCRVTMSSRSIADVPAGM
ncbi:MAG: hypothetical protein ACXWPO_08785, partial [Candidatus Limnocylindrales bacterium]